MINQLKLYLAGPMGGITWDEAILWREQVAKELGIAWKTISPITAELAGEDTSSIIEVPKRLNTPERPIEKTPSAFVTKDKFFIDTADVILFNFLGATQVSIGSIFEMGYASKACKPIIAVLEPDSLHDHPFVRRNSNVFVPTLYEAIEFLKTLQF